MPVRALHPNPWRTFAYLDADGAALFGLAGTANQVVVVPSGDVDQLRRDLFELPGVTAIEPASSLADALDNALEQFTGILRVIEVATLLLALLIAFNTASISADERTREHATMFAFGLPPRRRDDDGGRGERRDRRARDAARHRRRVRRAQLHRRRASTR